MRYFQHSLNDERVYFTAYIQDNMPEIHTPKRPLVVICPGGGYITTSAREAEPVALGWLQKNCHAIVLRYTTQDRGNPIYPNSLKDLAKLMSIIHQNADEWNVDTKNIFLNGFSAGAHLALSLAAHWNSRWLQECTGLSGEILRPAGAILSYPVTDYLFMEERAKSDPACQEFDPTLNDTRYGFMCASDKALLGELSEKRRREVSPVYHISADTPPTFVWATASDELVYVGNTLRLGLALEAHQVPFELHIFQNGPHGMSMATRASGEGKMVDHEVAQWFELAHAFMKRNLR